MKLLFQNKFDYKIKYYYKTPSLLLKKLKKDGYILQCKTAIAFQLKPSVKNSVQNLSLSKTCNCPIKFESWPQNQKKQKNKRIVDLKGVTDKI